MMTPMCGLESVVRARGDVNARPSLAMGGARNSRYWSTGVASARQTKLDADIPQLNEDQIFVRFLQIMAMVQDGHSGFDTRPIPPPADLKDHIPVRFVR
jgi:hypothetical protein